jgi:CheY-like chemotaxis protein
MLSRVFDMFTQVDRSLEKSHGGLGIGLGIVKRLVELHGGTVEARSDGEDQGSEFVVRLPVAAPAVGTFQAPDRQAEATPPGRCRILVVDDNVDSADSLGQLLGLLGHEVRTAYDGEAGVTEAEKFRPDVMLMDIGMPRLNGYDAARRIREQPWGKGLLLVALTGWGQEGDRQRSQEVGFDAHLVKPVDHSDLQKLLAEMQPLDPTEKS